MLRRLVESTLLLIGDTRDKLMIADSKNNAYHEKAKDEYVLSLGELLGVVWKRFWIVVLVTVLLMVAAAGLSFLEEPEYQASIKILAGQEAAGGEQDSGLGGAVQGLQDVTLTMAEAVETRSVAVEVIRRLDLQTTEGDLLARLSSEPVPNTQFIEVFYTDSNPEEASRVANAIGDVFSERVSDIPPNAVTVTVWDRAATPQDAVNSTPLRDALLAMVLGVMVGVGLAFLLEYLDDSWHSPEEAERVSGLPTFAVIPAFGRKHQKKRMSPPTAGRWSEDDEGYVANGSRKGRELEAPVASQGERGDQLRAGYRRIARSGGVAWPFGMALVNAKGEIEEANPALREMLGFEEEEFLGQSFAGFAAHPDDSRTHAGIHKEFLSGRRDGYQMEKRYVKKDGQTMWGRLSVSLDQDSGEAPRSAVVMVEDVSAQKQIEEELTLSREAQKLSEGRLRAVVEQSPLIVRTFAPDGSPLLANAAWDRFWDTKEREIEGLNLFEDEKLRGAGLSPYIERSFSEGEAVTTPVLHYEPEGSNGSGPRWLRASIHPLCDEAGRVLEVTLAIEDVTEHRHAEEALKENVARREKAETVMRESQERLRSFIRFATDASNRDQEDRE